MPLTSGERNDAWLVGGLVLAFATLVTTHLAIAFGLLTRPPRWRALVALLLPPMAPYWAATQRWYVRTGLWVVSAIGYVAARWLAGR